MRLSRRYASNLQPQASARRSLAAQLANAEGRADGAMTDIGHERARADRAIAAFESLAQRLEAMAQARRPWWRRLAG
jgi:hypothetical protein